MSLRTSTSLLLLVFLCVGSTGGWTAVHASSFQVRPVRPDAEDRTRHQRRREAQKGDQPNPCGGAGHLPRQPGDDGSLRPHAMEREKIADDVEAIVRLAHRRENSHEGPFARLMYPPRAYPPCVALQFDPTTPTLTIDAPIAT